MSFGPVATAPVTTSPILNEPRNARRSRLGRDARVRYVGPGHGRLGDPCRVESAARVLPDEEFESGSAAEGGAYRLGVLGQVRPYGQPCAGSAP